MMIAYESHSAVVVDGERVELPEGFSAVPQGDGVGISCGESGSRSGLRISFDRGDARSALDTILRLIQTPANIA